MGSAEIKIIAIDGTGTLADILKAHAKKYRYSYEMKQSIEKFPADKSEALILHDPEGKLTVEALLSESTEKLVLATPKFHDAGFVHDYLKAYPHFLCIPSPFNEELIVHVLENLTHTLDQEEREFKASAFPEELLHKYKQSIPEKILRISEQYHALLKAFSVQTIEDLKREVHKVAGNSGAYGYPKVSRLCKAFEITLIEYLKQPIDSKLKASIENAFRPFFTEFKLNFQNVCSHETIKPLSSPPVVQTKSQHRGVVLVTHNIALRRQFELVCKEFYLDILTNADFDSVTEQIQNGTLSPLILVVDEYYHLEKSSGLDLIRKFKAKYPKERLFSGMILIEDTLGNWIQKKQQEVDYLFHKPVTDESIRAFLRSVLRLETPKISKGLIVDDDPEFSSLLKHYLMEIGVETKILNDESDLINQLERFSPDILFLDLSLNRFDGFSILTSIRSNSKFNYLIIMITTASQDMEKLEQALKIGCDDFIQKPINPKYFQAKVQNILFRTNSIRNYSESNLQFEFLDKNSFLMRCEHIVQYLSPNNEQLALLYLDFQNLNEMKHSYPKDQIEKVVYTLEQIFRSHFNKSLIKSEFEYPLFAALLKIDSGGEIQFLIDYFSQKISNLKMIDAIDISRIHPRAGVVLFHPESFEIMRIDQAATLALNESFETQALVTLERIENKEATIHHNFKVIIIDDDQDLVEILKESYEKNGFEVITKSTGEEALAYFFELHKLEDKCLILLDRILPDMDSLAVLKKVREKFPKNVKALILSSLSTEQDILDGLKEGALDYITKPFSLPILMQKSKILLLK